MKAVILAAGTGSRIGLMSNYRPKSLQRIGDYTILEMMVTNILDNGINELIFILGHLQEQIIDYLGKKFPKLNADFVINDIYSKTNTGFSLMLAEDFIEGESFIKFDADIVFDKRILKKLIECERANFLCVDENIKLDTEEIKVIADDENRIFKVSKTVLPKDAIGESIGIEKIVGETSMLLFEELKTMMEDPINHQAYCEAAYERLIEKNVPFYSLDITGLNWVEIDTKEDYITATNTFA